MEEDSPYLYGWVSQGSPCMGIKGTRSSRPFGPLTSRDRARFAGAHSCVAAVIQLIWPYMEICISVSVLAHMSLVPSCAGAHLSKCPHVPSDQYSRFTPLKV